MTLISEKCPNCNGELQPGDSSAGKFCPYCGSKFILQGDSTTESPSLNGANSKPGLSSIILVNTGPKKIDVIRVIRYITNLDLKGALNIVESTPSLVKRDVLDEEAEVIRKKFNEVGAKVEIKRN